MPHLIGKQGNAPLSPYLSRLVGMSSLPFSWGRFRVYNDPLWAD